MSSFRATVPIIILTIFINFSNSIDGSFDLDINDILDENLMPGNLLFLDGPFSNTSALQTIHDDKVARLKEDGSMMNAISTMGFHRKMINEYMCTNFVAEQIISEQTTPISSKLEKRVGESNHADNTKEFPESGKSDIKENMLFDPGSTSYKNWLSKTTTLEDIYKHYAVKPKMTVLSNKTNNRRKMDGEINRQDVDEDYEEGDISGYAVHQPMQHFIQPGGHYDHGGELSGGYSQHSLAGSKYGHYGDHGAEYSEVHEADEKESKEMTLKDIFDIALTTLAFLSFGMFILHVLMCITMTKTDNNMMMMPMEEGTDDAETVEVRRSKRSPRPPGPPIREINEITRKVLKSIEAVLVAEQDRGSCLHRIICENNNFSRNRTDGQKLWMPVWGLGMTWLSSRLIESQPTTTSMMESLRASISGIGGVDCSKTYPNCNLEIQIHDRKKRRKKREAEMFELKMEF